MIAGGIVGGLSGLTVLGCGVYFLMRRRRAWHRDEYSPKSKNEDTCESHKAEDRESTTIKPFYKNEQMDAKCQYTDNSFTGETQLYWPTATSTITSIRSMADRI